MTKLCEASLRCQLMSERLCIINSGKAYDVTEFADRHPGGRKLLENHVGQDVTELMQNHENHKHSNSAYKILDKYYIGDLQVSNGLTYRGKTEINGNKLTNGFTNGHINGLSNGYSNGLSNGHSNGHTNGYLNGQTNGHMNGVANGHTEVSEEDLDSLVDWSKPIVWQVGDLGDKYFEWAHIPTDQPLRLFHSEICEFFSKSYWWLVLLYWVPITLGVIFYSYSQFLEHSIPWNIIGLGTIEVTPIYYPFLLIAGFLLWTLDEYVVHRWLFHCRPPGSSQLLIKIHFLFHGQHHKSPMDKSRLVFPPLPATLLAYIIFSLYKLFSPPLVALAMFAGTIIGYLMYDLVHYYLHHGHPSIAYFQNLKTYHVKHHFKHQNKGFGISSKLWDYPFGTLIE